MSLQQDNIDDNYKDKTISLTYIDKTNVAKEVQGIDLWLSEQHLMESEATHYPIEDGSSVSDNISTKPRPLTLNGFISNIGDGKLNSQRVSDGWSELRSLYENRYPIRVITNLELFGYSNNKDLYVTQITSNKIDVDSGTSVEFSIVLSELKIVESAETAIAAIPPKKVTGDNNPAKNSTSKVTAGTKKSKSLAAEFFDGGIINQLGGLF